MSLLREPKGLGAFVKIKNELVGHAARDAIITSNGSKLTLSSLKISNNGLKITETSDPPTPGEVTDGVGFLYMKYGSLMFHAPTGTISMVALS